MHTPRTTPLCIDDALSKRISALKSMLIVLIVYLHSFNLTGVNFEYGTYPIELPAWMEMTEYAISGIVASAAVPLFFLISGLLLNRKPFTFVGNLKKKARTVLLPFAFWNAVWILFFLVGQSIPFSQPYFAGTERYVANFTALDWLRAFLPLDSSEVFCSPLWFLSDLFRLNLLAVLLKKLADVAPIPSLAVAFVLWVFGIDLVVVSTEALLFFLLGFVAARHGLSPKGLDQLRWWIILPVYAAGIAAQLVYGQGLPVLGRLNLLLGMVVLIRLSGPAARARRMGPFLVWLSGYSFIVFVVHEYTQTVFKKLILIYLPRTEWVHFASYLLLPLFIVALCVGFGAVLRRVLPRFYALVTGGR